MATGGCGMSGTRATTMNCAAGFGAERILPLNFRLVRVAQAVSGGRLSREVSRVSFVGGTRRTLDRSWVVLNLRATLDFRTRTNLNVGLNLFWYNPLLECFQPMPQTCCRALAVPSDIETSLENKGSTPQDTPVERVASKEKEWTGPNQYREERRLNRAIVEAPDAEYVLATIIEALNKPHWGKPRKIPLSPLNCATGLHRIAKRMDEASMWKSEKLTFARRQEMKAFLRAAVKAFPECSAQGLANIAWALSKIGSSALFEEEMDHLADAALDKLSEFNAQNLANTAGAFASMLHAAPALFDAIAQRAVEVAGSFRPLELVQILWAFACLNHPLDPLFDSLDVQLVENPDAAAATFRGFSQQQLASMAWSCAVLQQQERPWFISLWKCVNSRATTWTSEADRKPKGVQHMCQLYQANLALKLECADLALTTEKELEIMLEEAWEKEKAANKLSSGDHREVDRLLVSTTGRAWVSEYEGAPYSLDLALVDARVAIEIDGPTHFSRNTGILLGHTVLKRRLLRSAGWTVFPIPFQEWEELRGEQERALFLRTLLEGSI
ncbi:RAP domain-containing protein, chloroplastic isoform X1 [Physcomitrium patens]|uniref:RAP domain-containing protein n=2 Tax=Physcomitrium patens TaxID=3218 RepID=A0A7I4DBV4_PHYPA|nr:RAP domain-containing protein, chloroplastic-like isoform X1 [Physcomitrium patens]|eukprot:XP_024372307.1 RAP domain-containing protein, chloroplastic-like isoform X1 [Physcomitrella patens]